MELKPFDAVSNESSFDCASLSFANDDEDDLRLSALLKSNEKSWFWVAASALFQSAKLVSIENVTRFWLQAFKKVLKSESKSTSEKSSYLFEHFIASFDILIVCEVIGKVSHAVYCTAVKINISRKIISQNYKSTRKNKDKQHNLLHWGVKLVIVVLCVIFIFSSGGRKPSQAVAAIILSLVGITVSQEARLCFQLIFIRL